MRKIEVNALITGRNDMEGARLHEEMGARGIFVVDVMGAPGAGKTSSLCRIIERLSIPAAVIEGDIEGDVDTRLLRERGIPCVQIETGGACHLNAAQIARAARELDLTEIEFLFIENIGNLICPAEFYLGEHMKLLICNITEGGDKPEKYPAAFKKAAALLLGKWDLKPYVPFDEERFYKGAARAKPDLPVFKTSALTGEGFDEVARWLMEARAAIFGG